MQWGTNNTIATGATATARGTGKANSDTIIAVETGGSAAQACESYSVNGFSDWYLPSFDELDAILNNLSTVGLGNLTAGPARYWTSTEVDATTADSGSYTGGSSSVGGGHTKNTPYHVRAVRAF